MEGDPSFDEKTFMNFMKAAEDQVEGQLYRMNTYNPNDQTKNNNDTGSKLDLAFDRSFDNQSTNEKKSDDFNNTTFNEEHDRKNIPCCMISPDNICKKVWDKYIALLIVFYGLTFLGLCGFGAPVQIFVYREELPSLGSFRLWHGY